MQGDLLNIIDWKLLECPSASIKKKEVNHIHILLNQ